MENVEYRVTFKKGEEIMLQKILNQEEFDELVEFYRSIKSPNE